MIQVEKYLPSNGFLRERQILGDPLAKPHMPALIPVSRSTWWRGIKEGRFPAPVKLGPRITAWRTDDIVALIRSFDLRGKCDE
jgi:prophage regulatory protein